ncbi:ABC transporter permease [Frankia sp. CNm7]|uniref:ABC transporter permease n=1 Tax=Frankia nepalensis TaxID=1836974 RepID=A0A937RA65_9ACTN|nr:ABC transporter permease [Frankia nepalensis]MBL7494859.1 ABC transporter permease [Frankia nepalensis]MBL7512213.1 ABC transporter permease [Frankia nepalensis]MBL7518210.1 ABC transporter permease [Frankia nepalensis]MBL7626572.1 ABC transporter permease [Frankia nepalensis]
MQTTIVILLGLLLVVALVAPRLRARSLVPLVCILLGWFWSELGFIPTITEVVEAIGGFFGSLPIHLN